MMSKYMLLLNLEPCSSQLKNNYAFFSASSANLVRL